MAQSFKSRRYGSTHVEPYLRLVFHFFLWSGLGWFFLSVASFFIWKDMRLSESQQISLTRDTRIFSEALWSLSVFSGLSFAFGLVLAVPAVLVSMGVSQKIEILQRRTGRMKIFRLYSLKVLPGLVFTFTQVLFLSLSLGSAPQFARAWSAESNLVSEWSKFVYDVFFVPLESKETERWKKAFPQDRKGTLIVQLPASLLASPDAFPKVKKVLGEPIPFFVDAQSQSAQLFQLLTGGPGLHREFSFPAVDAQILAQTWADESKSLDSAKNLLMLPGKAHISLAPELNTLEQFLQMADNLRTEEIKIQAGALPRISEKTFVRGRLAQTQVPLFFLFRLGLFEFLDDQWEWNRMIVDDCFAVQKFLNTALQLGDKSNLHVLQLSELEPGPLLVQQPQTALRWETGLHVDERAVLMARVDSLLASGLAQLRDRKQLVVLIVPYLGLTDTARISSYFQKQADGESARGAQLLMSRDPVLARDLFAVVSEFLRGGSEVSEQSSLPRLAIPSEAGVSVEQKGSGTERVTLSSSQAVPAPDALGPGTVTLAAAQTECLPMSVGFDALLQNGKLQVAALNRVWEYVRFDQNGYLEFPQRFGFFTAASREPAVLCRLNNMSNDAKSVIKGTWLVRRTHVDAKDVIFFPESADDRPGNLAGSLVRFQKQVEKRESNIVRIKKVMRQPKNRDAMHNLSAERNAIPIEYFRLGAGAGPLGRELLIPASASEAKSLNEILSSQLKNIFESMAFVDMQ